MVVEEDLLQIDLEEIFELVFPSILQLNLSLIKIFQLQNFLMNLELLNVEQNIKTLLQSLFLTQLRAAPQEINLLIENQLHVFQLVRFPEVAFQLIYPFLQQILALSLDICLQLAELFLPDPDLPIHEPVDPHLAVLCHGLQLLVAKIVYQISFPPIDFLFVIFHLLLLSC